MDQADIDKGERAHHITTTVYKDLQTNFTQGVKAIWSTGKALHKSLEVTAQKAKAHFDAITLLGQSASQSEGTVIAIGHALMQMAEIYKELQHQADENVAALKKDLCNPLEFILLDNSEKMEEKLKKYNKEHSKVLIPYKKATANLAKHRKKTKGAQNNKEMQYYREATETKQRLDRLRLKHLKESLFEEKKNYLLVFERLVTMTKNQMLLASKTEELFEQRLGDWEALTQSKDMSKDALKIIESITQQTGGNNNEKPENGTLKISTDTLSSDSGSLPRSSNDPLPSLPHDSPNAEKPRVKAMYSHEGEGDNQLAFVEDDILLLFGNKRDGWHYGQNTRTEQFGWFPISFTKALRRQNSFTKESSSLGSSSMSKLSRSVADLSSDDAVKNHRSFFQLNNSLGDERSTMTLPHRKNNSSSATQMMRGGTLLPPHRASLSQTQPMQQLLQAHHWNALQMAPFSQSHDLFSSNGFFYPPANVLTPLSLSNQSLLEIANGHSNIHFQQQQPLEGDLDSDSLYDSFLPPFPSVSEVDVPQNPPPSPPLPPPPSSLSFTSDSADHTRIQKISVPAALPSDPNRALPSIPTSPPPPPPPNMNQMVPPGHPGHLLASSNTQPPSQSTSMAGPSESGPPPPPPISTIPRANAPPPLPPPANNTAIAPPPAAGPPPPPPAAGPPPPPPLPPPGKLRL